MTHNYVVTVLDLSSGANLEQAHLSRSNLKNANLKQTNLKGAVFRGANLEGADFEGADLKGALNLTIDQLSEVKTLYNAELDDELRIPLEKEYPALFEKPKDEP